MVGEAGEFVHDYGGAAFQGLVWVISWRRGGWDGQGEGLR
jgi:hypothetical protein